MVIAPAVCFRLGHFYRRTEIAPTRKAFFSDLSTVSATSPHSAHAPTHGTSARLPCFPPDSAGGGLANRIARDRVGLSFAASLLLARFETQSRDKAAFSRGGLVYRRDGPEHRTTSYPGTCGVGSPQPRRRQMFRCGRLRRNTCPLRRRRRRPSQPSAASVTPQRMNERACRRCGAATWSSHRPYCVAHRPPPEARAKWAKKHPHGSRVRQRAPNPSRERRPPGRGGGGALPPLRSADRPGRAVGARPRAREAGLFRPSHFKCNRGL
jgi:hypothetical protein